MLQQSFPDGPGQLQYSAVIRSVMGKYLPQFLQYRTGMSRLTHSRREKSILYRLTPAFPKGRTRKTTYLLSTPEGSDFMTDLKTIDGETLMSQPLQPLNFVVDTLISQGLHILAGSPKVGKSWLALWLAVTVAKGESVWGMG